MRARALGALLAGIVLSCFACGRGEPVSGPVDLADDEATLAKRGAQVLAPFKRDLMAALAEGLAQGPDEAIRLYRLRAPELARDASSESIRVGRTSHRLRNRANAPEPWMEPLLAAYLADPEAARPRVVALDEGRAGYVEPIVMQPMCLTCHGDALGGDVVARLAELYPDDQAVGFAPGDLRGLFWVVFEAAALGGGGASR